MGIRIQPREIDIPEDDPFKNDLLGRKEAVEVLTHLVGSLEGPCVLAVDSEWGKGKTTFLKIWSQYLRNQEFKVVEFNAWKTDFARDPLVALSAELTEGVQQYTDQTLAQKIQETRKATKEILQRAVPGVIRLATAGVLDVGPLLEKELGQAVASYAEDKLSEYQGAQESVQKFRNALQNMANTLFESSEGRPLIMMIDELDRCRPSYAVELLEVAKHLFAVDHIVFVLAVNRSQLGHSIRAIYGSAFDAADYLRRFLDVDFRLPDPDRDAFINAILDATQINEFFERTQDRLARQYADLCRNLLKGFFRAPDLSLRRIEQAIHRLGLVLASLPSNRQAFAVTAVAVLILRTIDPQLYQKFVNGEASDLDVSDVLFGSAGARDLKHGNLGQVFEAVIIAAGREQKVMESYSEESISSDLLQQYENLVSAENSDNPPTKQDLSHAHRVIAIVKEVENDLRYGEQFVGFKHAVQRLELLSPDLIGE